MEGLGVGIAPLHLYVLVPQMIEVERLRTAADGRKIEGKVGGDEWHPVRADVEQRAVCQS